ncbi:cobalamin-binding protein [Salisediminibacterium halotolerans]|uniref:Iron complex transport system substrate-binding protein n=1 Tax=Salisediminibacterium halotolerans TaxID=517425 RepID=A0A1H9T905_9BACI|nr:cobalamin-binding protein [Salisediminibacterium haloalkalitolerans]SER93740.1 iron complex transport system substrate-binding protein [Salisediminibacterium haloalkalitolerans]
MRVVSLCPSNTELVVYLDKGEFLVGVDDYTDWPEELAHLPRVGPDLSIDLDAVEALKPDIVLASLSVPGMEKNLDGLEDRGLPYITLDPQSLADIGNDLIRVGEAIGCPETGKQASDAFCEKLRTFREKSRQVLSYLTIYWEWWPKPVFTPGETNWLTEISELAGGKNLFEDWPQSSVQTTWDDVLERKPDVICLSWVGVDQNRVNPEAVKKRPGWASLSAVKNDRVYVMEEPLFCRPSPRLLLGLEKLAGVLHPAVFRAET